MSNNKMPDPLLDLFIQAACGKKAMDILVLDLRGLTSITDFFIVCSGRSSRQVMAIADHIQVELKKSKIRPLGAEGIGSGHWILLDYDHVIIHVFYDPVRRFYNLEGLWSDAPVIQVQSPQYDPNDFTGEYGADEKQNVLTHDS